MTAQVRPVDELLRKYLGIGPGVALLVLLALAIAGVAVGLFFPKFEATALLQFPEPQKTVERSG